MENVQERKSVKKWVVLLIMPIVALILVAFLQVLVRYSLVSPANITETSLETQNSGSEDKISLVINLISLIVGVASAVAIILTPLWLVMLVRDLKGQNRSKTVAVVLAVIFGLFSWIYTFEINGKKFWINLGLTVVTIGYWSPVAWIWAVIDNASKTSEFYTNYNQSVPADNLASKSPIE